MTYVITGVRTSHQAHHMGQHEHIEAVRLSNGVVLTRTALAAWDLIGGRLVRPFDIAMPAAFGYWVVCAKAVAKLPKIVAFSEWLLAEAAEDARQLDRLKAKTKGRASVPS